MTLPTTTTHERGFRDIYLLYRYLSGDGEVPSLLLDSAEVILVVRVPVCDHQLGFSLGYFPHYALRSSDSRAYIIHITVCNWSTYPSISCCHVVFQELCL